MKSSDDNIIDNNENQKLTVIDDNIDTKTKETKENHRNSVKHIVTFFMALLSIVVIMVTIFLYKNFIITVPTDIVPVTGTTTDTKIRRTEDFLTVKDIRMIMENEYQSSELLALYPTYTKNPMIIPDGSDYYVYSDQGSSLIIKNISIADENIESEVASIKKAIAEYFESKNFKITLVMNHTYYSNTDTICSMSESTTFPIYVSCALIDRYQTVDRKPLVKTNENIKNSTELMVAVDKIFKKINIPSRYITDIDLTSLEYPLYRPSGADYFIASKTSKTFSVSLSKPYSDMSDYDWTEDSEVIVANIDIFMAANGLTKTIDSKLEQSDIANYQSADIICTARNNHDKTDLTCNDIKDYESIVPQIATMITAFLNGYPSLDSTNAIFRSPKISNSTVAGYEKASMTYSYETGGVIMLFYRKNSGEWQYFTSTPAHLDISCNTYNNADLRSAFAGDSCIDDKKTYTVVR